MQIDPRLGRTDRVVSIVGGAGISAFAFLGGFDSIWARIAVLLVGLVTVAGGVGGT